MKLIRFKIVSFLLIEKKMSFLNTFLFLKRFHKMILGMQLKRQVPILQDNKKQQKSSMKSKN